MDANWRQRLRASEEPLVYTLTVIAAAVGILVYGATKINTGRAAGLFANLRPLFGVPYGLLVSGVLIATLVALRQWKGLLVVAAAYGVLGWLELSSAGHRPFALAEYLALSAMLACLVTAGLLRHDMLD